MSGPISALGVEVTSDPRALEELRDEWLALELRSTGAPGLFSGHAWCASWWEHFATPAIRLHLLTIREHGTLVLLAPMLVEHTAALRRLRPIGGELGQYADVLVDARAHERYATTGQGLAGQALIALRDTPGVDVIELPRMREDAAMHDAIVRSGAIAVATTSAVQVDCTLHSSFDEWLGTRAKKMRQNQRRSAKAIAALGELWASADDRNVSIECFIDTAMAFKRAWLEERGLSGKTLEHESTRGFLVTLCGRLRKTDGLRTATLRLDGKIVATGLGFEQHGRFYYYLGAYEPSIEHAGPGRLQMENTLRWCFSQGVKHYDMLPPDTPFKHLWSDEVTAISTWLLPTSLRGRLYAQGWHQHLRPLAKRAYARVPGGARRVLGRVLFAGP